MIRSKNSRSLQGFSAFEVLEDRQLMSAAVHTVHALHTPVGAALHMPHAVSGQKHHIGPTLVRGASAYFTGTTSGTDPQGQPVSDHLTLVLTQRPDGVWVGHVIIVNDQEGKVTGHGKVTINAAGQITSYESANGETIVVTGSANSDWSQISGSYTGSNTQGQTWGGTFSLTRA